jgi:hypothetical protein
MQDRFEDARKRSVCLHCWRRHGVKIRNPRFELTEKPPLEVTLAMPGGAGLEAGIEEEVRGWRGRWAVVAAMMIVL